MKYINNTSVNQKPAYQINTKDELIAERDRMEANWDNSMRSRMQTIARISLSKFNIPISQLS